MSSQLIKQMSKNARKKQIIELKMQEKELNEVDTAISAESSQGKRKSKRIAEKTEVKSARHSSKDNIKINGLPGTVGDNLLKLGREIFINDKKSKYFSYLSKNFIIDISNNKKGSQMNLLGGNKVQQYFDKYRHTVQNNYNLKQPFVFDTIDGASTLKKKYSKLDRYRPRNKKEAVLKKLCVHILYQWAYLPHSKKYFNYCSEQSLLVQYWGNIFEHYGDTTRD